LPPSEKKPHDAGADRTFIIQDDSIETENGKQQQRVTKRQELRNNVPKIVMEM
jgi:hypothetical protein